MPRVERRLREQRRLSGRSGGNRPAGWSGSCGTTGRAALSDGDRVAEIAVEHVLQGLRPLVGSEPRLVIPGAPRLLGLLLGRCIEHAHQPLGGDEREKRGQRLGLLAHAFKGRSAFLDLGDVAVGDPLDLRHAGGGVLRSNDMAMNRQRAALLDPCVDVGQAKPEQAVAAAKVMVEEGERRAGGEGVQPERDLGQLDRHRVLVDAVHDALEDHAADEVPVVELRLVELPASLLGQAQNALANCGDALDQGRLVGMLVVGERHEARRGRDRLRARDRQGSRPARRGSGPSPSPGRRP